MSEKDTVVEQDVEQLNIGKQGKFRVFTENSVYELELRRSGGAIVTGGVVPEAYPFEGVIETIQRDQPMRIGSRRGRTLTTSPIQRIVRIN